MRYGFIKVCAATVKVRVADVKFNTANIISAIKSANREGAQLVVFPELCVTGYTCGDLFNQRALTDAAEAALSDIASATEGASALIFVGAPVLKDGKLYNCAVAITGGRIIGVVPKSFLPSYGEFYERRHFTPAESYNSAVVLGGDEVPFGTDIIFTAENQRDFTVACEICEDLWVPDSPSVRHCKAGANIIVNLSCSDETVCKAEYRRELVRMQSAKLIGGYVYCDAGDGESTTDMVFAGHNLICENGSVLAESKLFENSLVYGEIDADKLAAERQRTANTYFSEGDGENYCLVGFHTNANKGQLTRYISTQPFVPAENEGLSERAQLILTMQAKGLEKRLEHTRSATAVIGISGGLDSALALLVLRRAFISLGKPLKDIIAVTMPGFGTTSRTYGNSRKLIGCVGATFREVPIADSVNIHFRDIGHDPAKRDVTYENAQARMRTLILMDIANQTNGMVVGTGDLSELALGWATYNGDHMSMYGVNCSVPKTLVKHLVRAEAEMIGGECGEVLKDILDTEISPELLPPDENGKIAQKTEDLVGPYVLHDFFLYYALRWAFAPDKIYYLARHAFCGQFDDATILKWLKNFYRRFFSQQFKRSCVPDGVKVGSVTLSPRGDWRMPSDASCALWLDMLDDIK